MTIYADTSFLVSIYLTDTHTTEVERRLRSHPAMWMTPLHVAEWTHALEQHVFRQSISRSEADRFARRFLEHRNQGLWREAAVPEQAFEICAELAREHAAQIGSRTLGSLHVACALELKADGFWTFDQRQANLALTVGLKIN